MTTKITLRPVEYAGKRVEIFGRQPETLSGLTPRLLGLIPALQGIRLDNGQALLDLIKIGTGSARTLTNLRVPVEVLETALSKITHETRPRIVFPPKEGIIKPKTIGGLIPIMKASLAFPGQEGRDEQGITVELIYIFPSSTELFLRFDCFAPEGPFRADFGLGITIVD